jgi:quercetin dioxygenase-like cupin family protein
MTEYALVNPASFVVEEQEWGRLVWMVNGATGTSQAMTVGQCFIDPGQANPRHHHPNCDEVLYVLRGTIEHTVDDETFPMTTGDVVSIPSGCVHNARNVGTDTAHFLISFNTPDRKTIGQ